MMAQEPQARLRGRYSRLWWRWLDVRRTHFVVVDQFQPIDCCSTQFLAFPTAMTLAFCALLPVSLNSLCYVFY